MLWLAQFMALLLLAGMLPVLWCGHYADRVLASCLAAAFLLGGLGAGALDVGGVGLRVFLQRAGGVDTDAFFWKMLPILIVLPWLFLQLATIPFWPTANAAFPAWFDWRGMLGDRAMLAALAGLAYLAATKSVTTVRKIVAVVAGLALLVATLIWAPGMYRDSAPNYTVYAAMRRDIPPGAVVASAAAGGVGQTRFLLGRASYASQTQAVGVLFSREMAIEAARRLERLRQVGFPDSDLEWAKKTPRAIRPISPGAVRILCQDPMLDFVVLGGKAEQAKVYYSANRPVMSLYACDTFRESPSASTVTARD